MTPAPQSPTASSLNGRRAWVGGGSRGIGRACAERLASLGASVTVTGRDRAALDAALEALQGIHPSGEHTALQLDHADADAVRTAVAASVTHAPIHILVNNSGGPPGGPILDADPEAFVTWFSRHLVCNQILTQAVLPGMRAAGYGRIINIISTSVKQPIPGLGVSNTVRGAVASWAKTIAGEVAADGITVNNVLPGATATDRLHSLAESKARATGRSVHEIEDEMKNRIPAHRFAEPEEIAAAVGFLATPDAAYITGINLPVDGGRTASL